MDTKDLDITIGILTGLVENVRPDQLDDPTPCSDWNVRGLLNHLVGGGHLFAASFRGEAVDPTGMADLPDMLGDNPAAAFKESIGAFRAAVEKPGALDAMVTLPFATLPGAMTLDLAISDVLVHGWDLARATGQSFEPPADLVASADAFMRAFIAPEHRGPGSFGPEVTPAPEAGAVERLVAFAGRQP